MGYVFDFKTAQNYEKWFQNPDNLFIAELQDQLLLRLLMPVRGERILDIGCGAGRHLLRFYEMGLDVTGVDASPYMLDLAKKRLGHRGDLYQGVAEDLPFDDNSFDVATLITTLEFVEDVDKALQEASRVAKDRLFLGVLNRYSIKNIERRLKGIFSETVYNRARFFSPWSLSRRVRNVLGEVPMKCGTVHLFPAGLSRYSRYVERWPWVQKCPLGSFIGMAVTLVPRYRTRNIPIEYVRTPKGAVSGLMQSGTRSCPGG